MRRMRSLLLRPQPFRTSGSDADAAKRIASLVDADFYLKTNADVREAGISPALHYVKYGWREGRDPSPDFSTQAYLKEHRHLAGGDINPLEHFVNASQKFSLNENLEEVKAVIAQEFDAEFYAAKYNLPPDEDALDHFCRQGWKRGNNPCPRFSTSHYLTTNSDVKDKNINPFWHYLVAGRSEGRTPTSVSNWQCDLAVKLQPIEITSKNWLRKEPLPDLLSLGELKRIFGPIPSRPELIIAVGHDDYRAVPGGVQLCTGIEQTNANSRNIDYLHLHPWQTLPTLADIDDDPIVCIVLNGDTLGHVAMSLLVEAASALRFESTMLVCHHLSGHKPEGIAALAKAIGIPSCVFWLHDYFAMCTCFTLRRNDVQFCGAPHETSNACRLCIYGTERPNHAKRFQDFFEELDVHLISPSEVALKLWNKRSQLRAKSATVYPHINVIKRSRSSTCDNEFPKDYRVAFIGNPSPHKGWPVFEKLMQRLEEDDRFSFWTFGARNSNDQAFSGWPVTHVYTHVRSDDLGATIDGLRDNQIDLVVHWADWHETFSFSTFEAFAAGSYVVTNVGSGNVAAAVQQHELGIILPSTKALHELAEGGGLAKLAEASRDFRRQFDIAAEYSEFSLARLQRMARAV